MDTAKISLTNNVINIIIKYLAMSLKYYLLDNKET